MASAQEYAQWIVDNQDKQGTDEFETVARAYELAKTQQPTGKEIGLGNAVQTALPAVTGSGPTGIGAMANEIGGAVSPYAKEAVKAATAGYRAHPLMTAAIDTLGLGTIGTPVASAYNSAMGMIDQFGRAKGAAQDVGKVLSQSSLIESPITGAPYPESVPAFRSMQRAAPEVAQRLSDIYQKGGGNNAVKAWLASDEAAQFMKNPEFAAAAEQYIGKVPGIGAQAMRVAGPIMRGIGRVAGPAGLAMNAYDAAKYAQEAELGKRLAQGQGGTAQQQFRQMTPGYGQGFVSNISPDQAAAILQNGSPRDIEALGGQATLDALIKQKAAAKALGPVAPTGQ
jgi:hypothetical protein